MTCVERILDVFYMRLPTQAIRELQEIYESEFGAALSVDDAEKLGRDLLVVADAISLPKDRLYGSKKNDQQGRL